MRLPFSKRWAFQPEFQYLWAGRGHDDFVLLPNVSFDFRRPPARVRPFVILGVGMTMVRERFGALQRTRTWWHGSAGGGVKVFLNRRWFWRPIFVSAASRTPGSRLESGTSSVTAGLE